MGDPLSVTSGLIAIVTATVQASIVLHKTVQSFRNHQITVERLTRELADLTSVLQSLAYHVEVDEKPFLPLKFPLHQCRQACTDFKQLIDKSTRHSGNQRTSFRDWARLSYMSSDVTGFTEMLAGYKSTINIALADATLRSSKVTLNVLNEYKEMIHDTKHDLEHHLDDIKSKLQALSSRPQQADAATNLQRLQSDEDSTEKCLDYLSQVLSQLNTMQFQVVEEEPSSTADIGTMAISARSVTYADALTLSTFKDCTTRISATMTQIEDYKLAQLNKPTSLQLDPEVDQQRLQGEASSIEERLRFCESAAYHASQAKIHELEDIAAGNDSTVLCVSTVGDLFRVKGVRSGDGSFQFFGSTSESALMGILRAQNQAQYIQNSSSTGDPELVYASSSAARNSPAE
ncbi:hypothetical protein NM208_g9076 [Fusarium decemcellulare]|uniref:Uncharacterized protein n=1 Tax=Fusarium decemcellulare TaxID=57161 RepID=A0ACC1S2V6_9HYPO|nr:hypothetical protein NM208_g9076 [Fusarium decemcellulare]